MAEVTVYSAKAGLNKIIAGVSFIDGVGVCDSVTNAAAIGFFDRQGWEHSLTATLDIDPATVTVPAVVKNIAKANREELLAYAAANSIPIEATMTKKQLLERFNDFSDATAPAVTNQPANVSVADAAEASFTVVASGTAPLTYQWEVQLLGAGAWVEVEGATEDTLTFTAATADSTNKYRVVVSNVKGTATSNGAATLTVA